MAGMISIPLNRGVGAAMEKSRLLRLGEVRAALRLVGECRDLGHDAREWGRHMFAGLCRLTGARVGGGGEARKPRSAGAAEGVHHVDAGYEPWEQGVFAAFLRTYGMDRHPVTVAGQGWLAAAPRPGRLTVLTRRELVPDREWYGSFAYREYHSVIRIDHCLISALELAADGRFSSIVLSRATGEPDFAPRQRELLRLFHDELGQLIGPVLVSAGDPFSPTRLPPRVRETLCCLLEGDSEKQAATRMGLSQETVHQYVKALYRHYRVASRAELLARVLRRTNPGG
jgi:DNA-binding CsgD family transcriptional regulator